MIHVLFLRDNKALYPEIDAYINYFNQDEEFAAFDSSKLGPVVDYSKFDILWEMKGFGGVKAPGKIVVHDYASLSIPPFPKTKNFLKKYLNPKPNLRVFLNDTVRSEFNFQDTISYCFRDMGIGEEFFIAKSNNKEYEFVYVGEISKKRSMDHFIANFDSKSLGRLCLIGPVDNDIFNDFKDNKDLIFTGKVPYAEVPKIASKAVYGLNLIPNKYPYNLQTSTKLQEYLALGLNIITTDYKWVSEFEDTHACKFYKIGKDLILDDKGISKFNYVNNFQAEQFLWDKVIEKSNLKKSLKSLITN